MIKVKGDVKQLYLGRVGENKVVTVQFDYSAWVDEFGSGTVALAFRGANDTEAYPVTITTENGVASWLVLSSETRYEGTGFAELSYTVGDKIAKSMIWETVVKKAIVASGTAPQPWTQWINVITGLKEDAEEARDEAVEAKEAIEEMTATASVDSNVGTPSVVVTKTTVEGHENLNFAFANLKGATGERGPQGPAGAAGLTTSITMNGETKTQVGGNINLGAVLTEHQSLSAYRTSAEQDVIDATLQPKTDNSLSTTDKTVVGAINEVNTALGGKVADVQVNGTSIVSSGVATIPIATSSYGLARVSSNYGTGASDGIIRGVEKSASDYNNFNILGIISKGTLENIKTDLVNRALLGNVKTTMDAVAVANAQYYLGEQATVAIVIPASANAGETITCVFYSGATATALSISGSYLGTLPTPSANQRIELNLLYDSQNWCLLSNVLTVEAVGE